ncbi:MULTISPECIES: SMC-Scp complex subunit ScpB [Halomonadaceae]|uniref:SMC-Scp complex subunit ScpB n=1 Tax=Halomonadaceae TaxID=28256 RepID=UPI00159B58FA|nr:MULTISPECIES: SMC-Scp complex subunit ScpB [Halomonas]QJQ95094.1 SMC-Scp complex subunit ScpB [Halomonas sp. PA5]
MSERTGTHLLEEILEAALLAAGEPLSLERLEGLFDEHERPPRRELRTALIRLGECREQGALELIETASGYQLRIRARLSPWVSRLWDERPQRYSRALLETLALIAYRQPVTRGDIEEVRGVAVSASIMRTLVERGWIRVVGQRDVPGRPSVYATTRQFLDDFGLKTLDGLPPMHELKAFDAAYATLEDSVAPRGQDTEKRNDTLSATSCAAQADSEASGREVQSSHAEMASPRPGLSFADLEARLAERARESVADDGRADAATSTDEMSDES